MFAVLLSIAHAAPTHTAMDGASWSPVTTVSHADAGEIAITSATVSGVDCFRGVATTDVAADKMLSVVMDVEGSKSWSTAGITDAKVLSNSGGVIAYYQYLDVPGWTMASDRFWFLQSTVRRDAGSVEFVWDPLPSSSPHAGVRSAYITEHPDAVEPTVNVGSWKFSTAGEKVTVTYSICTQSGSIPAAIQSAATRRTLPDTVGDVVRTARKR